MKKLVAIVVILYLSNINLLAQDNKRLKEELRIATERLEHNPDSIDLRLKRAAFRLELHDWLQAKDDYDYILRQAPDNIAALYYRAYTNEKLGRYKFARLDYEHLLILVPGNFEGELGLALLCEKDNRKIEALDRLNRLVSFHSDSAVVYAARAGVELERGYNDLAAEDYRMAVRLEPQNTDYKLSLINALIITNRKEEARKALDALVKDGIPRASLVELYNRCKLKKR